MRATLVAITLACATALLPKPTSAQVTSEASATETRVMRQPHVRLSLVEAAPRFLPAAGATLLQLTEPEIKAAPAPKLFPPEAAWPDGDDSAPSFTPDGKTVFFTHRAGTVSIMMATMCNGIWSTPQVAPFSGKWRDIEPYMAPDGS